MKANRLKYLLLCFVLLSLSSCTQRSLSVEEYSQWMQEENNGLKVSKTVGQFEFSVFYKPHDYIALYENKGLLDQQTLEKTRAELGQMEYLNFRIGAADGQSDILELGLANRDEVRKRIEYLSFGLQNDLYLVKNGDTLPCSLFQFDRTYHLSPHQTFVLGFDASKTNDQKEKEDIKFIYDDQVLGVGTIKMNIESETLNKLPQLSL